MDIIYFNYYLNEHKNLDFYNKTLLLYLIQDFYKNICEIIF